MILATTLIALILRLILSNQSLWLDEAASVEIARIPLLEFFTQIKNDFHPPLFYLLLKAWLPIAGNREWLLRLPNIIFGTLSVPALYFLIKNLQIKKLKIAGLAALLLALNPLHIYYSQELRMYALNALLTLLSWLFLFKIKNLKFNIGYLLASIANIYTFYGAFFNLVAQMLYIFLFHRKKLKKLITLQFFIGLSFLPFLPIFLSQLQGGGYLTSSLPGWADISGSLSLKSIALIPVKFSLGRISFDNKMLYALVAFSFSSYLILLGFLGGHIKKARPFIFWLATPLILASLASLFSPMLGYWRYIYIIPAFMALIATGITLLPQKLYYINLGIVILFFAFFNFIFMASPRFHREGWRQAKEIISQPDSLVILNFSDTFAPLKFYAPKQNYYLTQKKLGKMRSDLDETLPQAIGTHRTIFVLDYLSGLTDPDRFVLHWLKNASFRQKEVYNINGVGLIYQFEPPI